MIFLVLDGVRDGDCVPITTQDIQLKYQRKPKLLLKGLVSKGKLCNSVLIMLSQSVISWIGESDQFGSAKSGGQAYWQCRMTGLM